MFNSRDAAFALVEEGLVSAEQMMTMALSYMSVDDVEEMLDANELSERFREDDDEDEFDGQPDEATEWFDFDPEC
tara:strand:+ start:261 stop:485 length:225 start_codon:yes stop_codon:yes gene_type:complete